MSTHLRAAAGVCAVSAGLLISAPCAIATADSDSDGGASHGQSASAPNRGASDLRGPLGGITDAVRATLQSATRDAVKGVTGTLNSAVGSALYSFPNVKPPKTPSGSTGSKPAAAENAGSPEPESADVAPPPAVETAAWEPPAFEAPALDAPAWEVPALESTVAVPDVVAPVSNVLAAVTQSVAAAPALVVSLPLSPTPVADVIASVQGLLTSVADAGAPLTQLPSDLSALLGVPGLGSGVTAGAGTARLGSSVALGSPMPTIGSSAVPFAAGPGFVGVPATDEVAGPPISPFHAESATSRGVASAETAVLTPAGDASSVLSMVEHVIGAFVASVSLAALAAVALPGIGGLLGACAAGIRIGYRQAKAGSELPTTVIARFVGSGPIGVVRSGSQVALHRRVVRAGSRKSSAIGAVPASRSLHLLDHAV